MASLLRDFRYSYRLFLQTPGFVAAALLSLALGIGANSTIFSVLNAILLRPFPVKEQGRLAVLLENNRQHDDMRVPTYASFVEWKQRSKVFENLALGDMDGGPATLTSTKEAVRVRISAVSTDFFSLVGVAPALGRGFLPEDSPPGQGHAIVLSHTFWERQFGGDRNVLGQTVAIEGEKAAIVGVMPAGFWYVPWGKETDVWYVYNSSGNPNGRWLVPVGRLRPGATVQQAQAEMDTFFQNLAQEQPDIYKDWGIRVHSLHEWAVGESRSTLYLLLGSVGFVLLIGCANVANLLLARANTRRKEFAVRVSLGASRLRLVRQLLTESLLLALVGGLLGVLVAYAGTKLFVALAPEWFGITDLKIDVTVLVFTCALSLLTGLLFGLIPALQGSRPDLNESLKEAGGRSSGGSRGRGRSALVVSEIALALLLLMGAGLMINSFVRLQGVDLGFDPKNILKAEIFLAGRKYWSDIGGDMKRVTPQGDAFFEQLVERAEHLPGVLSAGIGSLARMSPPQFRIAGKPPRPLKDLPRAAFSEVSPGYFRTMGIQLLKGRLLSDRHDETPWAIVVSDAFVRRFFPNEDPIGKVLYMIVPSFGANHDIEESHPREIIGVVRDVKYWGPRNQPPLTVYGSYRDHPWDYAGGSYSFHLWTTLVLRTGVAPTSLVRSVQQIVAELDKDQVVFDIMPLERMLSSFVAPQRFWMRLFSIFGGLALVLAVVGIYGVMSYSVSRRTHEIGIRMASGAQQFDILKLVLGHGLKLALIGVMIGFMGSLALTRLIKGYLYEVKATDPLTFLIVGLVLMAVALAASYIPARRAMKVDPMVALHHE